MTGRFIAIESLDGVGKTTLIAGLANALGAVPMATPGPAIKAHSEEILAALGDDQTARCLFYASTVVAQGRRARAIADAGGLVVMDRYWLSTLSYARARGVTADLSGLEEAVPVPDVTVLLTLDEDERRRRLLRRGGATAADIETLDDRFRAVVFGVMRCTGARSGGFMPVEIDVSGADQAEALARVVDIVRSARSSHGVGSASRARCQA